MLSVHAVHFTFQSSFQAQNSTNDMMAAAYIGGGAGDFPAAAQNLFDTRLPTLFAVIMSAAIVLLGPGAVSLDARLFGRREIIIPPVFRSPR